MKKIKSGMKKIPKKRFFFFSTVLKVLLALFSRGTSLFAVTCSQSGKDETNRVARCSRQGRGNCQRYGPLLCSYIAR